MDAWRVACRHSNSVLHVALKARKGISALLIVVMALNRSAVPGLLLAPKAASIINKDLAAKTSVVNPVRQLTIKAPARP
jgi:hypothetical protein